MTKKNEYSHSFMRNLPSRRDQDQDKQEDKSWERGEEGWNVLITGKYKNQGKFLWIKRGIFKGYQNGRKCNCHSNRRTVAGNLR